jgi:hypothetical protein
MAKFPTSQVEHRLLGLGVRQITMFYFNTYAMGLYLSVGDFQRAKSMRFSNDSDRREYLLKDCRQVSLMLLSARSTNGGHLKNAFTKMLSDRARSQALETDAKVQEAIQAFGNSFPKSTMQIGTQIAFNIVDGKQVRVSHYGKDIIGDIESEWLASNLLGVYLDLKHPLIESLKNQTFASLYCTFSFLDPFFFETVDKVLKRRQRSHLLNAFDFSYTMLSACQ